MVRLRRSDGWRILAASYLIALLLGAGRVAAAAEDAAPADPDATPTAPVVIDGNTLLRVRGVSAYPAEARAERIAQRIEAIAADRSLDAKALRVVEEEELSRIMHGEQTIMAVMDADAAREGTGRHVLADIYVSRITTAIEDFRRERSARNLLHSSLLALAATVIAIALLWVGMRTVRGLGGIFENRIKRRLEGLEQQSQRILSAAQLWRVLSGLRNLLWTAAILFTVVLYLDFLLHLFPWTRDFGQHLFSLVTDPLTALGESVLASIPKLLILVIIVAVMRYLLKALMLVFAAIAMRSMKVDGFEAEWAWPTFRLVRLLVLALTVVIAYPYIPGSQSEIFKGVSIFFGIIFSLGSSSLIGNIIAGYSLTYRRAFRIGDRVCIDEHIGDVVEMRLLVTHLCSLKGEEVIIPNSEILNASVINYSTFAREGKLILHSIVGIGYETPWRQVEAMLLEAAERTESLLREPKPFVLQKALGDFAVSYEINAYYDDANTMGLAYTSLHGHILDVFNEYGIQIMTPAYEGDPEQPKIVPKEQWYTAPAAAPR